MEIIWLAVLGAAVGIVARRRDIIAITVLTILIAAYVSLVGGDWMPYFRFLAPFEPFCFKRAFSASTYAETPVLPSA